MKIFLSYAAERVSLAEQVDAALEAEGHEVFFAHDSVPAATRFGRTIREAVRESDLFVFLLSPESVAPGSYCLSELGFASERWPDPADRVLPVVVAPTPPESFPPYVQSLSALHPVGNLAAEVVGSVERLGRRRCRARLRSLLVAIGGLGLIAAIGAGGWAWARGRGAATRPFLSVVSVVEVRPEVAGEPALVLLRGNARNPSPRIDSVVEMDLDLDGSDVRASAAEPFEPILIDGEGGENFEQRFRLTASDGDGSPPRRWRVCIRTGERGGRACQPWSAWSEGGLSSAPAVSPELRRRSRVVAAARDGFLVGVAGPHGLLVPGRSTRVIPLPGEPSAMAVAGERIAVGTRPPGTLVLLGPGTARSDHPIPGGTIGGSEASTGVVSIALTEHEAWVVTGGPDGDPAVRLLDLASGRWVPLPYADDRFAFDPRGVRLRAGPSGAVWAVTTETTPSSLYRLDRRGAEEVDGTRVPAVACARELAPAADGTLLLMSCDGALLRGRPQRSGFTTVGDLVLRFFPYRKGDWHSEWIAGSGDTLALAVTILGNDPARPERVPLVSRIGWSVPGRDRALVGFERESLAVTSLAARGDTAVAAVVSADGVRDLVLVPLRRP